MQTAFNASRASAWTFGARLFAQVSSLLLLLVAARMLSATELGFFALASAAAMLIARLAEAGWTQYVMAWQDSSLPAATVFWTGLIVAAVGGTLGALGGLGYAMLDHQSPFGGLMIGLCLLIPFGSVTALQYGVLTRTGRVGTIALITIAGDAIGLIAGLSALMMGEGVAALVINRAVMTTVTFVAAVACARWVPRFALERAVAMSAFGFARRLALTQTIEFGRVYGAEFLLALFLGVAEVGIYRLGSRIVGAIGELFSEPLRLMAWATLSRKREQVGAEGEKIAFSAAILALPSFVGLSLVSGSLVPTLLGEAWAPAIPVLAVLAIARLFSLPAILAEPMLVMVDQSRLLPIITAASTAISVILLFGLAPYGPVGAASSQVLASLLTLPIIVWAQMRYTGMRWGRMLSDLKAAIGGVAILIVTVGSLSWKMGQLHFPSWLTLMGCITAGGLVYGIVIALSYRAFCRAVIGEFLRSPPVRVTL